MRILSYRELELKGAVLPLTGQVFGWPIGLSESEKTRKMDPRQRELVGSVVSKVGHRFVCHVFSDKLLNNSNRCGKVFLKLFKAPIVLNYWGGEDGRYSGSSHKLYPSHKGA